MPLPTKCVWRRFPSRLNRTARSRRAGPRARRPPDQLAWQTLSRSAREGGEQLQLLSDLTSVEYLQSSYIIGSIGSKNVFIVPYIISVVRRTFGESLTD